MASIRKSINIFTPLLFVAAVSQVAVANELNTYLENHDSALLSVCATTSNLLPGTCPIGDALWGNQSAKQAEGDSEFWIQCGVFIHSLNVDKLRRIETKVNAPISLKKEGKGERCLIGPYQTFATAKEQLRALQREPLFKTAALREVVLSLLPKTEPTSENTDLPQIAVEPKQDPVTIRKQTIINGQLFVVPFVDNGNNGFYMEDAQPWLRATAEHSQEVCQQIGMTLGTKAQWQTLMDSNIMKKDKWPTHLPYWGANNNGFFKDGAIRTLKSTSMLNVMCTKKVEEK